MTNGNDLPRAVIGSGHWGMAAVINALLDIAVRHPQLATPVQLHVVNTKVPQPGPDVPYPMNGIAPDDLHPFLTPRPPAEFPTFGEYVRVMSKEDPTLAGALEAPTYGQVTAYMDFMMELAIIAAGEKVDMIPNRRAIDRIDVNDSTGSAVIFYSDKTELTVTALIEEQPAHMGGVRPEEHRSGGGRMSSWYEKPPAVIGSGLTLTATVINTLLDIASRLPASGKPVELLVVDTGRRQPEPGTPYPMNGIAPDDLHPFESERPPAGYRTFGDHARVSRHRPTGTLDAPAYEDISFYLNTLKFLTIAATSDKVAMTRVEKSIDHIETSEAGFATILFNDDTRQLVTPIMAKLPPHLGGVVQEP